MNELDANVNVALIDITMVEMQQLSLKKIEGVQKADPHFLRLIIQFQGVETDPRPIFEIPMVRKWVRALYQRMPYCLIYLDTIHSPVGKLGIDDSLELILACLSKNVQAVYKQTGDQLQDSFFAEYRFTEFEKDQMMRHVINVAEQHTYDLTRFKQLLSTQI